MKSKALLISLFVLLLSTVSADAQERRPFLARLFRSPAVREVANFAIHQFLPGFPQLPSSPPSAPNPATTKIIVAPVVKTNLAATKSSLERAEKKLNELFKANGLKLTADAKKANAGDEDDPEENPKAN